MSFKDLVSKLDEPVTLSDKEKEKIKDIFKELSGLLDEKEAEVLDMTRDDAYKYMRLLLRNFSYTDSQFEGVTGEVESEVNETRPRPTGPRVIKKVHPDGFFRSIYDALNGNKRIIADKLDCVKTALAIEESGDGRPEDALCGDCSLEMMQRCINVEDPTVVDEMDQELSKAASARQV